MKTNAPKQFCVLGIAPSSRGFGFAIMAPENTLLNWGVKSAKSGNKNERSLANAIDLISRYKPSMIAVENPNESRRGSRVQAFIHEIISLAEGEGIEVKQLSPKDLNIGILKNEDGTKHDLAERLAAQFPDELGFRLPKKRRLWMSEAYQMDIFQAVALAQCAAVGTRGHKT